MVKISRILQAGFVAGLFIGLTQAHLSALSPELWVEAEGTAACPAGSLSTLTAVGIGGTLGVESRNLLIDRVHLGLQLDYTLFIPKMDDVDTINQAGGVLTAGYRFDILPAVYIVPMTGIGLGAGYGSSSTTSYSGLQFLLLCGAKASWIFLPEWELNTTIAYRGFGESRDWYSMTTFGIGAARKLPDFTKKKSPAIVVEETKPEPVPESTPVVEETKPEPMPESAPVVEETKPEPMPESAPVIEEIKPEPMPESAPVVEEIKPEPIPESAPVVEEIKPEPMPESAPVVEEIKPEPMPESAPVVEEIKPEPVDPIVVAMQNLEPIPSIKVERIENTLQISVVAAFTVDSVRLSRETMDKMDSILAAVKDCTITEVTIRGYVAPNSKPKTDKSISLARAETAKKWLQEKGYFTDITVNCVAMGAAEPIGDGKTTEDRAMSRRVRIDLTIDKGGKTNETN